jgi:hypothetical protein
VRRRKPPPPDHVAAAAEAITVAESLVHSLSGAEPWTRLRPSLRAVELRHIADALGDLRKQILDLYSVK